MTRSHLTCKPIIFVGIVFFALSAFKVLPANGANILGVFLTIPPSHLIVHMSIMKALAEKGHNITVVSPREPKITHENIKAIIIPPRDEHVKKYENMLLDLSDKKAGVIKTISTHWSYIEVVMDIQMNALVDERFTALYENKDNKFDVAIMGYFLNDFQVVVGGKFNCPIIYSWMLHPIEFVYNQVGIPEELSYIPTGDMPLKPGELMDFPTRFKNFLWVKLYKIVVGIVDYASEKYYNKLAANDPLLPPFGDMKKNISLLFSNSHYSEGTARPLPPATVLIGGIQIKEKPDPLPKDIANFLESSKENGAILFSLGTNLKDRHSKPETIKAFFNVLSTLEQNVIWKWGDLENTPGNASNIVYKNWLPQDDILAHPNLKLFITHAGKGGVVEATYHGVPMVAVPMFGDQPGNAQRVELAGFGIVVDATSLTETEFRNAINEVLTNTTYATKVKTFSDIYRDRPLSAKESAVYWTEYVIRHKGARFMQSPVVHLNYIQSSSLDVHALIVAIFYIAYKLLKLLVGLIKRFLFAAKWKKSKTE